MHQRLPSATYNNFKLLSSSSSIYQHRTIIVIIKNINICIVNVDLRHETISREGVFFHIISQDEFYANFTSMDSFQKLLLNFMVFCNQNWVAIQREQYFFVGKQKTKAKFYLTKYDFSTM